MTLAKLIGDYTTNILKKKSIQDICKNICTKLDKYDNSSLDKLDAYVESQVLQLNKISKIFVTSDSKLVKGGTNELIEYNSEIMSFDNSDAHKSAQKKRISYGLMSLVVASTISTILMFIFLKLSIEEAIGVENVMPILKKLMTLNPAGLVDIVTKGTIKQAEVATSDMKFYVSLVKSGDIFGGLYKIFQTTDGTQHLLRIETNIRKINYAFSWFKYSGCVNVVLIGKLVYGDRPAALKYTKNMGNKKPQLITQDHINSIIVFDKDKKVKSNKTKSNKTKSNVKTRGGNKTKKTKTKKN
jgi:hypothetical protein